MLYDGTILSHPKIDGYKCRNLKVSFGSSDPGLKLMVNRSDILLLNSL